MSEQQNDTTGKVVSLTSVKDQKEEQQKTEMDSLIKERLEMVKSQLEGAMTSGMPFLVMTLTPENPMQIGTNLDNTEALGMLSMGTEAFLARMIDEQQATKH